MALKKKGTKPRSSQKVEGQNEPKGRKAETVTSLDVFWKKFQLSPNSFEHSILSSPLWMSLIALGPILLLILFSYWMALPEAETSAELMDKAFADLRDPIFTTITLALWFGAMIYTTQWHPNISKTFRSLFVNGVLYDKEGKPIGESNYVGFLNKYLDRLHNRGRYILPLIFLFLLAGGAVGITIGRGYWEWFNGDDFVLLELLHFLARWVIAPLFWGFVGGYALWTVVITAGTIKKLTPEFQINVQPLHSDRAGGLKEIGDLCSQVGLTILVILIPAMFLAVRGTANMINTHACGSDLKNYAFNRLSPMTEEEFAKCVYHSQGGVLEGLNIPEILGEVNEMIGEGTPLQELAANYYSRYASYFERDFLLRAYDIYLVMDFFLLVMLVFSVFIFIVPMWDIHKDMLESQGRRERETNRRIGGLYNELTDAIQGGELEKANTIKTNIKFFAGELEEIQKYPVWPISSLPVLRSFLTSGLLSSLVTYIFSLLKVAISPEAQAVIDKIIAP